MRFEQLYESEKGRTCFLGQQAIWKRGFSCRGTSSSRPGEALSAPIKARVGRGGELLHRPVAEVGTKLLLEGGHPLKLPGGSEGGNSTAVRGSARRVNDEVRRGVVLLQATPDP